MKKSYKGFEIEATRDQCLGGWDLLYYSVMRESDSYFVIDNFEDSDETEEAKIGHLKTRVDDFLEHPEKYESEMETGDCLIGG